MTEDVGLIKDVMNDPLAARESARAAGTNARLSRLSGSAEEALSTYTGYEAGLDVTRNTTTGIRVSTGGAYIPGLERVVTLDTTYMVTGLSLNPAISWYYVYLLPDPATGLGTISVSDTAPAAPYTGTARTMAGDTSQRFLGSLNTTTVSTIRNFFREGEYFGYLDDVLNRSVLSGGNAIVDTNIDCSAFVPPHVKTADVVFRSSYGSATMSTYLAAAGSVSPAAAESQLTMQVTSTSNRARVRGAQRTDANQLLVYCQSNNTGGGITSVDILGFWEAR